MVGVIKKIRGICGKNEINVKSMLIYLTLVVFQF